MQYFVEETRTKEFYYDSIFYNDTVTWFNLYVNRTI